MKKSLISRCEKSFLLQSISEGNRLDGRQENDFRELRIHFGNDWGCCVVSLGETKVLAQVSCEVTQPKATRPNEGLVFINVELSPMGAPEFEIGPQNELCVQLNRLLEKCFINSSSVDLESLCIVAEEKVWRVRVDVNVLNHEGNLVDAASVAVLAALNHFRRPDVTCSGDEITIHDPSERDPIPITLHHHPVCVSYAIFNKGKNIIADPSYLEERISEAQIVFGMNAYREVCGLHLGGNALATLDTVISCAGKASVRAAGVVQKIKNALAQDQEDRAAGKSIGFSSYIQEPNILTLSYERLSIRLQSGLKETAQEVVSKSARKRKSKVQETVESDESDNDDSTVVSFGKGTAELIQKSVDIWDKGDNVVNQWEFNEDGSSNSTSLESEKNSGSSDSDIEIIEEKSGPRQPIANIFIDSDEEEDITVTLQGDDVLQSNLQNRETDKHVVKPETSKPEDDSGVKSSYEDSSEQKNARTWYPQEKW